MMIQLYKHSEEQYLPGDNHAQMDRLRQTDTNRPYRYGGVGNVRACEKQNAKKKKKTSEIPMLQLLYIQKKGERIGKKIMEQNDILS